MGSTFQCHGEPGLQSSLSSYLDLVLPVLFLLHLPYFLCVFSLCRHWWICAAGLPVRTEAHVSRLWPRLAVCAHQAGPAPTATCPTSRVRWQLHREVKQHPLCFLARNISPGISFPPAPVHVPQSFASRCLVTVTSQVKILCVWESRFS